MINNESATVHTTVAFSAVEELNFASLSGISSTVLRKLVFPLGEAFFSSTVPLDSPVYTSERIEPAVEAEEEGRRRQRSLESNHGRYIKDKLGDPVLRKLTVDDNKSSCSRLILDVINNT
jgi:hypothetical protein